MSTIYNDGASHTVTSGTFAGGIVVDVDGSGNPTTLILSNATVTGADAHLTYPPSAFSDAESATPGILVMPTCVFTDAGGNTITGGNGLAGITTESDGTPGLDRPTFGPADALLALGAHVTFGNSTYQGGSYQAGATGSAPMEGGAGARIINPASLDLGSTGTSASFTGGASESTMPGPPAFAFLTHGAAGFSANYCSFTGGTGASTGPSILFSAAGAANLDISGGSFSGNLVMQTAATGVLSFTWASGSPGTLTTSSVSGSLYNGGSISVTIVGASGATEFDDPGGAYSTLTY